MNKNTSLGKTINVRIENGILVADVELNKNGMKFFKKLKKSEIPIRDSFYFEARGNLLRNKFNRFIHFTKLDIFPKLLFFKKTKNDQQG